jgi:hypothetical protein
MKREDNAEKPFEAQDKQRTLRWRREEAEFNTEVTESTEDKGRVEECKSTRVQAATVELVSGLFVCGEAEAGVVGGPFAFGVAEVGAEGFLDFGDVGGAVGGG